MITECTVRRYLYFCHRTRSKLDSTDLSWQSMPIHCMHDLAALRALYLTIRKRTSSDTTTVYYSITLALIRYSWNSRHVGARYRRWRIFLVLLLLIYYILVHSLLAAVCSLSATMLFSYAPAPPPSPFRSPPQSRKTLTHQANKCAEEANTYSSIHNPISLEL